MNPFRTLLLSLLLAIAFAASAHQVTDTLFSSYGDRVIVTYDVVQKDNKIEIRFKDVRKKLGTANSRLSSDMAEIVVVFFDRIGFNDVVFKGLSPSVFMIPSGVKYEASTDGYFNLDDKPILAFEDVPTNTEINFNIPVYLSHYEKKHRYKIFAQCNNLDITVRPKATEKGNISNGTIAMDDSVEEELLSDVDAEALASVNYVMEQFSQIERLPFSDMFLQEVESLKKKKFQVQNKEIASRIDLVLEEFENKKAYLEEQAAIEAKRVQKAENKRMDSMAFAQCTTIEACEAYLNAYPNGDHVAEAQQKKAELEADAKEQASKEKRNKIWMIIGGILLAILLLIGNQALQSFRSMKMQRNMMKMQENVANQAKSTAKRKAQGEIRKQTGKIASQVNKKSKDMVRNATNKTNLGTNKGNNNRVSI